jgi:acyl carrier protein
MKRSLLEIINEVLIYSETQVEYIEPTMDLRDDLGMDSLALAQLTVIIESEYGIDIFENGLVSKVSDILEKINE